MRTAPGYPLHESVLAMPVEENTPQRPAILLVDDEPAIVELLAAVLEGAGYHCYQAHNGAEALDLFRLQHEEIELVLTDFYMPMMNGMELTRALRGLKPGVKIILSSGSLGEYEHAVATELQVCAALPKPWTATQVVQVVDEAIRSTR